MRKTIFAIAAVAALTTATMFGAAAAQADQTGDGNPAECKDAYVVASQPLTGERGPTKGKVIGHLELRWSWQCHANWARVELFGKMHSSPVTVEQEITVEGRSVKANDHNIRPGENGTSAWTPYLKPRNSESTACVAAWVSSDFGSLNFHTVGARFCV